MRTKILISYSASSEQKVAVWNGQTWNILDNESKQIEERLTSREFEDYIIKKKIILPKKKSAEWGGKGY